MRITMMTNQLQSPQGIDLQVNEDQRIEETLAVLGQAGLLSQDKTDSTHIYSERRKQYYHTKLTYRQAMIWNGDILQCR